MKTSKCGTPDANKPRIRFDGRNVAPATPRRGSLLCASRSCVLAVALTSTALAAFAASTAPELKVHASNRGGNAGTGGTATSDVTLTWTVSDYGAGASSTGPLTLELSETSDFATKTDVVVAGAVSGAVPISGTYTVAGLAAGEMRYARLRATNDLSVVGTSLVFPFSSLTSRTSTDWVSRGTVRHVDNQTGSDETGDGSAAKPYATIARAAYHACQFDRIVIQPGKTYELASPVAFPNLPLNKEYAQITIESAVEGEQAVLDGGGVCYALDTPFGGMYYKDLCVTNCTSSENECGGAMRTGVYGWGEGAEMWRLGRKFERCTFVDCTHTTGSGGALYLKKAIVEDCDFIGNRAAKYAGAVCSRSDGNGRVLNRYRNCRFVGNVGGTDGATGNSGGAVHCHQYGTQEFYDCTFISNRTDSTKYGDCHAGAINHAVNLISNCTFFANSAHSGGGAVYVRGSDVEILDSRFIENHVHGGGDDNYNGGGAVYSWTDSWLPTIRGCTFVGNTSTNQAGGAVSVGNCAELSDCVFSNNWSGSGAAALRIRGTADIVDRCSFVGNDTTGVGGALVSSSGNANTLAFRNCLFARNTAGDTGGAAHLSNWATSQFPVFESCTFAGNAAGGNGAAIYAKFATVGLTNCLFSANTAKGVEGVHYAESSASLSFDHCFTEGDPKFADAAGGDYMLKPNSPCRNAGVNLDWMLDATDLAARPKEGRIAEDVVDIGCYEYWPLRGFTLIIR
ncbi:MAG: right-handed parallel beta-helix repeat-containing protein [Kiritimatiellia bacterium]|jgi:hypothetical protein